MTKSHRQQERQFNNRKQAQNPHGKVKTFEQLSEEAKKQEGETT